MTPVPFNPAALKEGDCLLYKPSGVFGWIISIKTWHAIGHCEGFLGTDLIGRRWSVASRDGPGVNTYELRTKGLALVLRPIQPFDQAAALEWFRQKALGQKYDWLGLIRFAWRAKVVPDRVDNKQFCSEFLARWYRAGGLDCFNGTDADAVAPFMFELSPYLQTVWRA